MEQKQTAVEWLEKNISLDINPFEFIECFNKAKQMEKQQIIKAFDEGTDIGNDIGSNYDYNEGNNQGYQYYNQEYGK